MVGVDIPNTQLRGHKNLQGFSARTLHTSVSNAWAINQIKEDTFLVIKGFDVVFWGDFKAFTPFTSPQREWQSRLIDSDRDKQPDKCELV